MISTNAPHHSLCQAAGDSGNGDEPMEAAPLSPDDQPTLRRFRQQLAARGSNFPSAAFDELEREARRIVTLYLTKKPPLRPSFLARKLKVMARGLHKAAEAAELMGEDGMLRLLLASNANGIPEHLDPLPHIDYLARLADWAERAAETAAEESQSELDHRGGRTPDENLRNLIVQLMDRFAEILSLRPTHTIDPDSGLGSSLFDIFVKEAIAHYGPAATVLEPQRIDLAIQWALPSRDLELFAPPPLPEA